MRAYRQDFHAIAVLFAAVSGTAVDGLDSAVVYKERVRAAFANYAELHSAASIRRCRSTWNTLCDYPFIADIIVVNPMPAVLRPKVPNTVPKSFDNTAVLRLAAALMEPDEDNSRAWQEGDFAIVFTALLTGCQLL